MLMTTTLALLVLAGDARPADHATCPMKAHDRKAEVDGRHREVTGIGPEGVHAFLVSPEGGTIRLEAGESAPPSLATAIRAHLREVAPRFAAGDFEASRAIHGELPDAVRVLQERREALRWVMVETPRGGEIRVSTTDPRALAALHEFLRFQVADHHTEHPDPGAR